MNKSKIGAFLLLAMMGSQISTVVIAKENKSNYNIQNENSMESKKTGVYETLYEDILVYINSSAYSDEGMAELLAVNNILDQSEYISKLDVRRKVVLGSRFRKTFIANKDKEDKEFLINWSLLGAKVITESSKLKNHHNSGNERLIIVCEPNSGKIDITDIVFELDKGQELDKNTKITNLEVDNDALSIENSRIFLDTTNLTEFYASFDFKVEVAGSGSYTNILALIKNNKDTDGNNGNEGNQDLSGLYDDISDTLKKVNYKEELLDLLEKNDNIVGEKGYISRLDDTRRSVFATRYKERFMLNDNQESLDEKVKGPYNYAKSITESSKLVGHHDSNTGLVEIEYVKNTGKIDITDSIKKTEGNQVLSDNTSINVIKTMHPALSVDDGKVFLDTTKEFDNNIETYINIYVGVSGSGSNTGVKVKLIECEELFSGWKNENNNWYYYENGIREKGWKKIDGLDYYFDTNGIMQYSKWIDNYYLDNNGIMAKNKWIGNYYCGADGQYVRDMWVGNYYCDSTGAYVKNEWIGNYYCGADGQYVKDMWVGDYYCDNTGAYVKNTWVGNYYCDSTGAYVKNTWVGNYYCGANGQYIRNSWVNDGGTWYYCDDNGIYLRSTTEVIDGEEYSFGSNGACLNP